MTCTTVFQTDQNNGQYSGSTTGENNKKEGLSSWLSKSGNLKSSGRRQSLDLLIDAGDKVKDVFTSSFFGKTLERRNSESEIPHTEQQQPTSSEFFSFRLVVELQDEEWILIWLLNSRSEAKEGLSDEQVLNLELDKEIIVTGRRWPNTYGN